ncbi:dynein beta chain, ciliary-like [Onthophagus taurus]|uniref:dynein beta chain, ciliary-like n=1 Tax=Onthophagus taurus TaxID=166361 RepID=UPI000C20A99B|nr:dynein beta chain, ciliary-like [Onthophagus taurus]
MGDKKKDEAAADHRLDFVNNYLTKSLKLKQDKWAKMFQDADSKKLFMNFLDNGSVPMMIMYMAPSGLLTPSYTYPANMKSKGSYFIRRIPEILTVENMKQVLIIGDYSYKSVEELSVLTEDIFVPLLSNPKNHVGWPKVVAQDVQAHIEMFKNTVYQLRGALKSQPLLPLPPGTNEIFEVVNRFTESEGADYDLHLKAAIENAVIIWFNICSDVLKQNSRLAFAGGANPTPMKEVEFWNFRLKSLECIYDQLRDPRVKQMIHYLELTESSYLSCFKSTFKNIVAAILEARDICLYLKPMIKHFLSMEEDFLENDKYIKPLCHVLGMLWAHSRYYCTSSKMVTLLQEIGNLFIEAVAKAIDPSSIFQGEPEEVLKKLIICIDNLELFTRSFENVRNDLESYFPEDVEFVPWNFHARNVFQRLFDFMTRLNLIRDILETTIEFLKLEKVEIGGLKGRSLSSKVIEVLEDFNLAFKVFPNIQYDILLPEDHNIETDYREFMDKCYDLDRRLAAIFVQALDECINITSFFKFVSICGSLLERPVIAAEIYDKYKVALGYLNEECDTVKILYDEGIKGVIPIDKYFPPVAGRMFWLMKLRERIAKPGNEFKLVEHEVVQSEEADYVYTKWNEMLDIIKNDEHQTMAAWLATVPGILSVSLNKTQLTRQDGLLALNLDKELVCLLREVKYLRALELEDIDPAARELFERYEELYNVIMKLIRIVEWYNHLKTRTLPEERGLIADQVDDIDVKLSSLINNLTWASDNTEFIEDTYNQIKDLYDRVLLAESNISHYLADIDAWAKESLYERREKKDENPIMLDDRKERVQRRFDQVTACAQEIDKAREMNYMLYFNIPIPSEEPEVSDEEEDKPVEADEGGEGEKDGKKKDKKDEEASKDEKKGGKKGKEEEATKDEKKVGKKGKDDKPEEAESKDAKDDKGGKGKGGKDEPPADPPEPEKTPEEIEAEENRTKAWNLYEVYLDKVLLQRMISATHVSFSFFNKEMVDDKVSYPLFELLAELHEPNVIFMPSVDLDDPDNVLYFIQTLLQDIHNMSLHMPRIIKINPPPEEDPDAPPPVPDEEKTITTAVGTLTDAGDDPTQGTEGEEPPVLSYDEQDNYLQEILDDLTLKTMYDEILNIVANAIDGVVTYEKTLDKYSYLWIDDRKEYLEEFLKYARQLTADEIEMLKDETADPIPESKPTIPQFKDEIDKYEALYKEVEKMPTEFIVNTWLRIDLRPLRQAILNIVCKWSNMFKQHLVDHVMNSINELEEFIIDAIKVMQTPLDEDDYDGLLKVMGYLFKVKERTPATDVMFEPLKQIMDLLKEYGVEFTEEVYTQLQELPDKWLTCKKVAATTKQAVAPLQAKQINAIKRRISVLDIRQSVHRDYFRRQSFFKFSCTNMYKLLDKCNMQITELENYQQDLGEQANLFELTMPEFKQLKCSRKELRLLKQLWDFVNIVNSSIDEWKYTRWKKIDVEGMEMELKKFAKEVRTMDKEIKGWDVYIQMEAQIKNMLTSLRAVTELQNPAIRDRHWIQLMQATKVKFVMDDDTTLNDLLALKLHEYEEEVKTIVDKSVKEMAMEKVLKELNATWTTMEFGTEMHERTKMKLLVASEELIETLEDNQGQLQNMMTSKFIAFFLEEVSDWQKKLSNADQVINIFFEVQRKWTYLESIFVGSEDIRNQLPEDSKRFDKLDKDFKDVLGSMTSNLNVVKATNKPGLYERLEVILQQLLLCEKALNDYLETKRLAFPRFYFVSSADLLDILSNGNQPELVGKHLTKLFDNLAKLVFVDAKRAKGMISKENEEYVEFPSFCDCSGKVEVWLNRVIDIMRATLHKSFGEAIVTYDEKPREVWIFDYPAQPALCGTQIWWTTEVNVAFSKLEEGYENSVKDYNKKQIAQLGSLIVLLLGDLTPGDRQKTMTICTIDVHSRDVVAKMIVQKVESSQAFQWQSQLRHRWDVKIKDCFANICDAQFRYQYEYLGNTPRLVITPLTDRCYITLTQSLHLIMGGAPAGPAGTGKTETTKDLGKALGIMVYVFNCSEQMDYRSCGNIYKGLAQTGTWGCFDEFNRISVEVLSVVAVQVKCIQDAIKDKKQRFFFLGADIILTPTIGIFITMNPGYAGRTELPENLKALFRPCAMVVPDFELICEIMLVAEGFLDARLLARKFITLYTLCKELLSKQDHYDWGLRAIKSVLVVAGSLKRSDRQRPEDQVLMRALRDFNIPKIVTDDVPVFMGLIGDLFPALDVPRKRNVDFEKLVKASSIDLKLQPEEGFVLKIVQLEELFAVRHSVFIIGFAGTGKTMVWKTLNRTYFNQKRKPFYNDLNPKAVTNDELFGVINPATREWKDGLFSVIMRDQVNIPGNGPKWIVLDGDIDPMWIESLNTLMDDNKVLTLASNERIALTPYMRLLFEIASLRTATPATVSRAGILYINPADLGWNPYVASWIDTRTNQSEKANLMILFDKYVPPCLDMVRGKVKKITPISEIAHISMLCFLLDCFLTQVNVPADCPKEWYEIYFVFSTVWAFGSALFQDQITDWRNEFSKWFTNEFKTVKFPAAGTVFHYYIEQETKRFSPWTDLVKPFELDPDIPLQSTLVNTAETTRIRFFMDHLMEQRHPIMLIGSSGSGKSVLVAEKLNELSDSYAIQNVPFNFYTTSEMLQKVLEKPLEKKAGRVYGPPGNKLMIYFVDDMNMPEVDKYFTVQPHTLIRQHMDYQHWYDRQKLSLKDINNVLFVSCMNPTAGSFTINPRLQRHFCVFAVSFPANDAVSYIYNNILGQHIGTKSNKYNPTIEKWVEPIVAIAMALHGKMSQTFLPTAIKFHYVFNLRDLSNIFQGILFTTGDAIKTQTDFIRLWMHEATRVYCDKLVDAKDIDTFTKMINEIVKKGFEEINEHDVMEKPLIFCHFADGIGDPKYNQIHNYDLLSKLLNDALGGYNDLVAAMNLVLFEDAMNHVCRINRIMEAPRGNGLMVGVGGSGKQSLTRLSSFISSLEVFQIQLKKGYAMADMKADIAQIYNKAILKNISTVFLMTDAQVPEEKFLVIVNDMLASGEVPDLLADDEMENIINAVRGLVKAAGQEDTKETCWKFVIDKVRKLMKILLCFSPVGSVLRIRARKFPAVVSCTSINWFHEWPKQALISVSTRFLSEIEELPKPLVASVSLFMSHVHSVVNDMSVVYLQNDRRYNYTTPKTFLEQIALYSKLLKEKVKGIEDNIMRLEVGLLKLAETAKDADGLKDVLAVQEVELAAKNADADKLVAVLSVENEKVSKEQEGASEEEAKVKVIEEDVGVQQKLCEADLVKAEPALLAAQAALNTLNKNNLTELKSFGTPPDAVVAVAAAVLLLFSPKGKIPKDRSWKASKLMMGKVDQFLNDLIYYDKENMNPEVVKVVRDYLKDPEFTPEKILAKSIAAAGLCAWVINIVKFYDVFVVVEPKRKALAKANADLNEARQRLLMLKEKLDALEEQLAVLRGNYDAAMELKMKCQKEADATNKMIDLARRLVNGLASESVRWKESIKHLHETRVTIPGDILLVTAFISYVGCFTRNYRIRMQDEFWIPFIKKLEPAIPMSEGLDPLSLLTSDAQIAQWNNEGLPTDRMSAENATILTNSARWPLMIDPQLQGIKWIKTKYGAELHVIRLTMRNYLDQIENCISNGSIVLLENIGETVDAVLDPVLGRVLIKKGRCVKIGDKEVDYDPRFRLILHTKLANPHYKPEIQAQTTLINFTVTRDGLEEQLLAEVVKAERPDLELLKSSLTKQQNDFKITLKYCEDTLLERLSSATGNILGDEELVINLETTKKTSEEIQVKVAEAKITSVKIDEAREQYRPAAGRASLIYFILNDLNKINAIYQFSLKAFSVVFKYSLSIAEPAEKLKDRLVNLLDSITFSVFMYTTRGLFECDKLTFMAQMSFQILLTAGEIQRDELDFLLRFPIVAGVVSPMDFLSNVCWGGIKALSLMDEFKGLDKDLEGSAKRWNKFVDSECPEKEKLPGEWKNKSSLQRLCMMRALRPDRMTYAVRGFIEEKLGSKFITARTVSFEKSYEETSNATPTFFILSPGVNPLKDVERIGKQLGFAIDNGNFHSISLGQGQEIVAENAMDVAAREGHWVILQNIHLVARWLPTLEKKMEQYNENSNENYRLYLSAEAAADPANNVLPPGILESSIKITNEPPTGMFANLHKALDNFTQETLEMSSKETEFKTILFSLCYFHAVVAERRKFGPQGWNRNYPFNVGDLTISVNVLYNYLENNARVPWEDLRYLFGEIMYGGHITDDWDRRLCRTYLQTYMQPELLDGELYLAVGFLSPPNTDYVGYHRYIDDRLPPESPYLYGLHPNAEIGFLTNTSEMLFKTIFGLQPKDAGAGGAGGQTREEKVRSLLDDILDRLPPAFNVQEMMAKIEDRSPYIIVCFQECDRMNALTSIMRRSLTELDLGLKGELTITSEMESLEESLFMDKVPDYWAAKAYPSLLPLGQWYADLGLRVRELEGWTTDFSMPSSVWLGGFFNPQSFLTAIMQQTARKNEWPLDKMCLLTDVTKKQKEDFTSAPREGAYVNGLFMEGAKWDTQACVIGESKLKELFPVVPVVFIKAITQDKQDLRNMYDCPVYKTRSRGPTFVWTFNLKTKEKPGKWTLAGVAILLQI